MTVGHAVQFYERETDLAHVASEHLATALRDGGAAVVVTTPEHVAALVAGLAGAGIDVAAARQDGRLVVADARATLDEFLTPDGPDAATFDDVVGTLVRAAAAHGAPVHVYGDMVGLLWDTGDVVGALALEDLWNDLAARAEFTLLCGYAAHTVDAAGRADLCARHGSVAGLAAERTFERTPAAARHARHFVVDTLRAWGRGHVADDAAVVVTELAANAILHAASDFTLRVAVDGGTVRIAIRDADATQPVPREAGELAEGGRGLRLVGALSRAWGLDWVDGGKVVWAEVGA